MHPVDPFFSEKVPSSQVKQDVAASKFTYFPFAHNLHWVEPALPLYEPGMQLLHVVRFVLSPNFPASQSSQDVEELKGCAVPPSHAAQLLWPVSLLYVPGSHTRQLA